MLVLDTADKSITAVLGATPTTNPGFVATYADATPDSFTEAANDGALNGTTAVTLVAAPSSGVRRVVKEIVIYNCDSSQVELTVAYKNSSNSRIIWKGYLASGETWALSRDPNAQCLSIYSSLEWMGTHEFSAGIMTKDAPGSFAIPSGYSCVHPRLIIGAGMTVTVCGTLLIP